MPPLEKIIPGVRKKKEGKDSGFNKIKSMKGRRGVREATSVESEKRKNEKKLAPGMGGDGGKVPVNKTKFF